MGNSEEPVETELERALPTSVAFPSSYQQEHIWAAPNRNAFNIPPMAIRLRGDLRIDALQLAVNDVIARHEVLRVNASPGADGRAEQSVSPVLEVIIPVEKMPS